MRTKFWSGHLKERDHLEDLGVDERISEWILRRQGGSVWTAFIWLRIETGGELL
jgi:hypothetical protein